MKTNERMKQTKKQKVDSRPWEKIHLQYFNISLIHVYRYTDTSHGDMNEFVNWTIWSFELNTCKIIAI